MTVTLIELIDKQIQTTLDEQDTLVADPTYSADERKAQADWNDGWVSAMLYVKQMISKGAGL